MFSQTPSSNYQSLQGTKISISTKWKLITHLLKKVVLRDKCLMVPILAETFLPISVTLPFKITPYEEDKILSLITQMMMMKTLIESPLMSPTITVDPEQSNSGPLSARSSANQESHLSPHAELSLNLMTNLRVMINSIRQTDRRISKI